MYRLHLAADSIAVFLADGRCVWSSEKPLSEPFIVLEVSTLKEAIELFSFSSTYPMAQASLWVLEIFRAKNYLRHH